MRIPRHIPTSKSFPNAGRQEMMAQAQKQYGSNAFVLKARKNAATVAQACVGHTLTGEQATVLFKGMLFPDWGGKPNRLTVPGKLVTVTSNKAYTYLWFVTE